MVDRDRLGGTLGYPSPPAPVCKLARQSAEGCEWNAELLQPRRITRLFRTRLPPSRWEQLQAILQSAVGRCCRPPGRFKSSALKHPIRGAEASTSLRRVCLAMQAVVANRPFQAPNLKNKCGTPPPLSQMSSRRSREDAIRRARGKFGNAWKTQLQR